MAIVEVIDVLESHRFYYGDYERWDAKHYHIFSGYVYVDDSTEIEGGRIALPSNV